jgi:TRAP-type C4-dicarboxylate transport system substrate-binding protein
MNTKTKVVITWSEVAQLKTLLFRTMPAAQLDEMLHAMTTQPEAPSPEEVFKALLSRTYDYMAHGN